MLKGKAGYDTKTIFKISKDLKLQGKTVGFTHGAFDLLHYGHIHLLKETARKVDIMIVGIESDKNVSAYKAKARPILHEKERAEVIQSLGFIDFVFINNRAVSNIEYLDIYKKIALNLIPFGRNFSFEKELKERAFKVKAEVIKVDEGFQNSTSDIIDKIVRAHK